MVNFSYISFVLIIPLVIFLITGLFGKRFQSFSGILGTVGMLAAACLSYFAAYEYFIAGGRVDGDGGEGAEVKARSISV